MIDPATGWFEIVQYNDKQSATISNLLEHACLYRYARPTIITYDHGNYFLGHTLKNYIVKNNIRLIINVQLHKIHKQNIYWK